MINKTILATFTIQVLLLCICSINAQTTEFTYQGSLNNGAAAANGNYDFEFALFSAASGGSQIGSTVSTNSVVVANGIFSVKLDFGNQFAGSARFLEIRVRQTGGGVYTPLTPRQPVNSAPYAVKSLNADVAANATSATTATNANQLGGVAANQYVLTGDVRLSDSRNPTAGSTNYIQNSLVQQNAGFSITGDGALGGRLGIGTTAPNSKVEIIDISNKGLRVQTNSTGGTVASFGGLGAFHVDAQFSPGGRFTILENGNIGIGTFLPETKLQVIGTGSFDTGIFNGRVGIGTTTPNSTLEIINSIGTGLRVQNNFAGGTVASFGGRGSFLIDTLANPGGRFAVLENGNIGIGTNSPTTTLHVIGDGTLTGDLSASSGTFTGSLSASNGTFTGSLSASNGTFTGSLSATNSTFTGTLTATNGIFNTKVGIGTANPQFDLHIKGKDLRVEGNSTTIFPRFSLNFTGGGADAKKWQNYATTNALVFSALNDPENFESPWLFVNRNGTAITGVAFPTGKVAIGAAFTNDTLGVNGTVSIGVLGAAGSTALCFNASSQISTCSSSIRYKNNVADFTPGLDLIRRLRPVSFNWKGDNKADMGLVAEEVNAIEPLLTTTNDKGEVEGVKYDRVGVVLVNAVNEQQMQIEAMLKQLEVQNDLIVKQQTEIEALKLFVCSQNPILNICVNKEKQP